jgi:hypothetical protein
VLAESSKCAGDRAFHGPNPHGTSCGASFRSAELSAVVPGTAPVPLRVPDSVIAPMIESSERWALSAAQKGKGRSVGWGYLF